MVLEVLEDMLRKDQVLIQSLKFLVVLAGEGRGVRTGGSVTPFSLRCCSGDSSPSSGKQLSKTPAKPDPTPPRK